MVSPYTKKVNGREQTLIRHLYHLGGGFESYIYHDGWFQFAGSGYYDVYKNWIRETVDYDTYAGKIIRFAKMKAFDIIDNDTNLSKPVNKLIKERFNSEYLKLFLKTTIN